MDDALNVMKMATKEYPQSAMLWKLYSDLHCRLLCIAQNVGDRNVHYKRSIAACLKGIQCVEMKDAPDLYLNMMDVMIGQLTYLSIQKNDKNGNGKREESDSDSDGDLEMDENGKSALELKQANAIHKGFRKGIQHCLSHNDELKERYLRWMVMYHGEDEEKQMEVLQWFENQTLKSSPRIYKMMFDIYESILLFGMDVTTGASRMQKGRINRVGRVYERCVLEHGAKEAQMWVWYVEWCRKYKKLSDASAVYQRAMKMLRSDSLQAFLTRVELH